MSDNKDDIAVTENEDGSAVIDLPESLTLPTDDGENHEESKPDAATQGQDEDADHPDDDTELRQAKRNRRRAKKDLVRKTNEERNVRLEQLQRENQALNNRLANLERNTRAGDVVRIEKDIQDHQVTVEYAKLKMKEAVANNDGDAFVEAQSALNDANDKMRQLSYTKQQIERQPQPQQEAPPIDPTAKRNAEEWMRRNPWYQPGTNDRDSLIAKKTDEVLAAEGWSPSDPDYFEELDSRLQKTIAHRYTEVNNSEPSKKPRNSVGSAGREASASFGGSNRNQFVLSPERVAAMKASGAWENPERKQKMIASYVKYDRENGARK